MRFNEALKVPMIAIVLMAVVLSLSGCSTPTPAPTATPKTVLKLATTTSVQDSGLLDNILPAFEDANNVEVQVISAGSGQALAYGEAGDVDVLIVHSPAAEQAFMDAGHGWNRTQFAHNFYVIVGPENDQAGIKGSNATGAFRKIYLANATFVSRGDNSGTNAKEKDIWNKTGLTRPSNKTMTWYKETGQGMADTLRMTDQLRAYTLSDISTFLYQQKNLTLTVLVENDTTLINKYDIIIVNQTQHPSVNYPMAKKLLDYLTSAGTQAKIRDYGKTEFGRPLFFADLLSTS